MTLPDERPLRRRASLYKIICQWYGAPPLWVRAFLSLHTREDLRSRSKSPGDSPAAGAQSGAVLDPDRRDAERRLALRERARDAEAGARAAAPRACGADRSL